MLSINRNECTGIIDTSTTIIVASNEEMRNLLSKLKGVKVEQGDNGNYQGWYSCYHPPEIKFRAVMKNLVMNENTIKYWQEADECRLPFTGLDGFSEWIFGTRFLEMASVVFDFYNALPGFAAQ